MKRIKEIAINYVEKNLMYDNEEEKQLSIDIYTDGYKYAFHWIPIEKEIPLHNQWVIVKTDLCRFPCQIAQFRLDKFISTDNFIVANISYWRPLEIK